MSSLIFLAFLAVTWAGILKGLNVRERVPGVADGEINGYRYIIVQRGNRIYVVLPDYQPRERCQDIVRQLLKKLQPEAEIEVVGFSSVASHCNYCLEPSPFAVTYNLVYTVAFSIKAVVANPMIK